MNSHDCGKWLAQVAAAALLVLAPADLIAQSSPSGSGRFAIHPYLTLGSGSWQQSWTDPVNGETIKVRNGGGNGFGLRLSYFFVPRLGLWVGGDGAVAQEGGYWSAMGGASFRWPVSERIGIQLRAGAGRLESAPFATGAVDVELFLGRRFALAVGGEYTLPIGNGSKDTGFGVVSVERDGGPKRLQLGVVWYPF